VVRQTSSLSRRLPKMKKKILAVVAAPAAVAFSALPSFAAVSTDIENAVSNAGAITDKVTSISTVATGVVVALLGASLILWAAAVGFKALRRGFK